jgi:hypothetical protein
MSENGKWGPANLFEDISLTIQELRRTGKIPAEPSLLRIHNPGEMTNAPFMFDMVNGRLHRAQCAKIPTVSRSALYAVWQPWQADLQQSCEICRPATAEVRHMKTHIASDIVFGFLSLLDQFSSVLIERGKEYRNSTQGRQLEESFDGVLSALDQKQKEVLDLAISSLEVLLEGIEGRNGNLNGDGTTGNGAGPRQPTRSRRRRTTGKQKGNTALSKKAPQKGLTPR